MKFSSQLSLNSFKLRKFRKNLLFFLHKLKKFSEKLWDFQGFLKNSKFRFLRVGDSFRRTSQKSLALTSSFFMSKICGSDLACPTVVAPSVSSLAQQVEGMTLTPDQTTKAQKYCKYAISALDYDDLNTARLNLTKALNLINTGREES